MIHFIDGLIIGTGLGLIISIIKNLIVTLKAIDVETEEEEQDPPIPDITYIHVPKEFWDAVEDVEEAPDYFKPF